MSNIFRNILNHLIGPLRTGPHLSINGQPTNFQNTPNQIYAIGQPINIENVPNRIFINEHSVNIQNIPNQVFRQIRENVNQMNFNAALHNAIGAVNLNTVMQNAMGAMNFNAAMQNALGAVNHAVGAVDHAVEVVNNVVEGIENNGHSAVLNFIGTQLNTPNREIARVRPREVRVPNANQDVYRMTVGDTDENLRSVIARMIRSENYDDDLDMVQDLTDVTPRAASYGMLYLFLNSENIDDGDCLTAAAAA